MLEEMVGLEKFFLAVNSLRSSKAARPNSYEKAVQNPVANLLRVPLQNNTNFHVEVNS